MCNRRAPSPHRIEALEPRRLLAVATWDGGGANNFWTTPENWAGDVAPLPGDELRFDGTVRTSTSNDFPAGTPFHSLSTSSNFLLGGNGISLAAGYTTSAAETRLMLPITLTADQTFSGTGATVIGAVIETGGRVLTLRGSFGVSGLFAGSGAVVVDGGPADVVLYESAHLNNGGTTVRGGTLRTLVHQRGSSLITVTGGTLHATSFLPDVRVEGGIFTPGGDAPASATISTARMGPPPGSGLWMADPAALRLDLDGPTEGSG